MTSTKKLTMGLGKKSTKGPSLEKVNDLLKKFKALGVKPEDSEGLRKLLSHQEKLVKQEAVILEEEVKRLLYL